MDRDTPKNIRAHWLLDPAISYLNHGSYGACPTAVLEEQFELMRRLEREPVDFLSRDREGLLDQARAELCSVLGGDSEGLVFVRNATEGINSVLKSLELKVSDEILVTNHDYPATRNVVNFVAEKSGARVVSVDLPFVGVTTECISERIVGAMTPRTRIVVFDHVTSQSGLIFPIVQLCKEAAARGIPTLVDGAHGPGMVPLELSSLQATYYVGNCHKWLCAPKGAGFLYVHEPVARKGIRPVIISHGASDPRDNRSRFQMEFDWTGTQDWSAVLSIPAALRFIHSLYPGGLNELMARNCALVIAGRKVICNKLSISEPCSTDLLGALATIWLGEGDPRIMQQELRINHRIEALVCGFQSPQNRVVRVSAQAYNSIDEYEALGKALCQILRG
jgi:isopenicillin-N epimerase